MQITAGKKYTWYINQHEKKKRCGFFTGSFDKNNGNAILTTRNGETWSIPLEQLIEANQNE